MATGLVSGGAYICGVTLVFTTFSSSCISIFRLVDTHHKRTKVPNEKQVICFLGHLFLPFEVAVAVRMAGINAL